MAVKFDGVNTGSMPLWTATGDFSMTIAFYYNDYVPATGLEDKTEVYIGYNDTTSYIASVGSGNLDVVLGGATHSFSGYKAGHYIFLDIDRTAGVTTVTDRETGTTVNGNTTDPVNFNIIGSWGVTSTFICTKAMRQLTLDNGTDIRDYDFSIQSGTSLVDLIGGQNITLTADLFDQFHSSSSIDFTGIQEYNINKRDGNNQHLFALTGTCVATTAIEVSTDGGTVWNTLDASPTTTWSGNVLVTKEQKVIVRLADQTSKQSSVNFRAEIIAGAIGQSNNAGFGLNSQPLTLDPDVPIPLQYVDGRLQPLIDPTALRVAENTGFGGSIYPAFVSAYANNGDAVTVINTSVSATTAEEWQDGNPSGLWARTEQWVDAVGGASYFVMIQGEQDAVDGNTTIQYEADLTVVANQIDTKYSVDLYMARFPRGDGIPLANAQAIWQGIDNVTANVSNVIFGGDLSTIDISQGQPGRPDQDLFHLNYDADLQEAGNRVNAAVIALPPTITLNQIAGDIVAGDSVTFVANATASSGTITQVEFEVDNVSIGNGTETAQGEYSSPSWTATAGAHTAKAIVTDSSLQVGQDEQGFTVANPPGTPPTINITVPAQAINGTTATFTAIATADGAKTIDTVQFFVDAGSIGNATPTQNANEYEIDWTVTDGIHQVTATATDSDGLQTTTPQSQIEGIEPSNTSTYTLTVTGMPNGTYSTEIHNETDGSRLFYGPITYSNGSGSQVLAVPPGTVVRGSIFENDTNPVDGGLQRGTTV